MDEASPSPVFSQPPGFPKAGVVDPESGWPGTATSADWFSGPDNLSWTPKSQEQPPELLGPKDAEVEVVLPIPLCQQPPPRPWLQAEVLPSFGESGGPCLVAPAHQPAHIMAYRTPAALSPCTSVEMAHSPPVAQYCVPTPLL